MNFELAPTIPPIAPHTSVRISFVVALKDKTVSANIAPKTTTVQNIIKPHKAPLKIPLLCLCFEHMYPPKYVPTPRATVESSFITFSGASILVRIKEKNSKTSAVIRNPANIAIKTKNISFLTDAEERLLVCANKKSLLKLYNKLYSGFL